MATEAKLVVLLGAGADDLQHEGDLGAAMIKVVRALKKDGYQTLLVDNNPFQPIQAYSDLVDEVVVAQPTVAQLTALIADRQPVALLPTLGGKGALQVAERLATSGVLNKYGVQLMGLPLSAIRQVNNPSILNQTLRQIGAPTKKIGVVTTFAAAQELTEETGFPVVIRSFLPQGGSLPRIVRDPGELQEAVSEAIQHSPVKQALVQQSLAGLKEIGVLVARDHSGTMMQLAMLEDLDPIGIHAGDSIGVLPAQTLLDRQVQTLRNLAFKITRKLRVVGINHVQFALDTKNDRCYVIKNSPYLDRVANFTEQATGYPVARVYGHLVAGQLLRDIRLDHGLAKHTAAMEPVMDRTAVRLPVFANRQLGSRRELTTEKQSIGSVIGVGRSLIEALMKALNELAPTNLGLADVADDDLDQLLIHPEADRLQAVFEALRRGYSCPELSELTRLDQYYLDQFTHLIEVERALVAAPGDRQALARAKYWGFSDRLIAQLWGQTPAAVGELRQQFQLHRTYKEVDPSAGELDQHLGVYYATFEVENESQPTDQPVALVVGGGPRQLGSGVAKDYLLVQAALALKRQDFRVVVVNNSPTSALLDRDLAAKVYLEPRDLERLRAIVNLERPAVVVGVGEPVLTQLGVTTTVDLAPVPDLAATELTGVSYALNALHDGRYVYPLGLSRLNVAADGINDEVAPDLPADLGPRLMALGEDLLAKRPAGLYQVVVRLNQGELEVVAVTVPPAWQQVFLSQVTGLDVAAAQLRLARGKFNGKLLNLAMKQGADRPTKLVAHFPYAALHLQRPARLDQMLGASLEE